MNRTQARLIEEWSDEIIDCYLSYSGISNSLPIPILNIAEDFLLLKLDIVDFNESLLGVCAISIPQKSWILADRNQSNNRLRFSVAHEIAHWIIEKKHMDSPIPFDWNLNFVKETKGYKREQIANYFASCLLIPRFILSKVKQYSAHLFDNYDKLSELFGVSYQTLDLRFKYMDSYGIKVDSHKNKDAKPITINANEIEQNDLILIIPPVKYFDNRFISQITQLASSSRAYILLSENDLEAISDLSEIDIHVDFIIARDKKEILEQKDKVFGKCRIMDFSYIDRIYEKMRSFNLNDIAREEKYIHTAYLRDGDRTKNRQQLEIVLLNRYIEQRIKPNTRSDAKKFINECKLKNKTVVIVTGCFDIITNAHIRFLEAAKQEGDVLVVGIENDQRVRKFKGSLRPLSTEEQRIELINALRCVDYSFIIHGSPNQDVKNFYSRLHKFLSADILAISNGDPHTQDKLDEIKEAGGRLAIIDVYQNDGKTTTILRKLLRERLRSDFIFLPKKKIYEWKNKDQTNDYKQLELPI